MCVQGWQTHTCTHTHTLDRTATAGRKIGRDTHALYSQHKRTTVLDVYESFPSCAERLLATLSTLFCALGAEITNARAVAT